MSKALIIAAIVLIVTGLILFTVVMSVNGWNFGGLGTVKYVTNEHTVNEGFTNIVIDTSTADIVFLPSDGECGVVCYEDEKEQHSVTVVDGTLTIKAESTKKWYEHIGIGIGSPKITVYLPKSEYGALSVKGSTGKVDIPGSFSFASADIALSTGDVRFSADVAGDFMVKASTGNVGVNDMTAGTASLAVSTGKVTVDNVRCDGNVSVNVTTGKAKLCDVKCGSLDSTGSTGDISLEMVLADGRLSVERNTGDVKFVGTDAGEIFVKTSTGDVEGTLLTEKVFITETDTGDVNVPESVTGGRCKICTDTGDIEIEYVV